MNLKASPKSCSYSINIFASEFGSSSQHRIKFFDFHQCYTTKSKVGALDFASHYKLIGFDVKVLFT